MIIVIKIIVYSFRPRGCSWHFIHKTIPQIINTDKINKIKLKGFY